MKKDSKLQRFFQCFIAEQNMLGVSIGLEKRGKIPFVATFGAFVDLGVHQDGLVHISELSNTYVKNPMDIVSVGDIVKVRVLEIDIPKKRISLSMKSLN